jgi:hypothetical protein
MDKLKRLELEISAKADWSTSAFDEGFGCLGPQDFVNICELTDMYMDILGWENTDEVFAKVGELTNLNPDDEIKLSPTYKTNLIGLYNTIGALIASDREYNALSADEKFERDKTADTLLNIREVIQDSPEYQQELRDAIRKLRDDNK